MVLQVSHIGGALVLYSANSAVMDTREATFLRPFTHLHGLGLQRTLLECRASTCLRLVRYIAKVLREVLQVINSVGGALTSTFSKTGYLDLKTKSLC